MKIRWLDVIVALLWGYIFYGLFSAYQIVAKHIGGSALTLSQKLSLTLQMASQNDTWYGVLWLAVMFTAVWVTTKR